MSDAVVLILGAGPNIGRHVASTFAAKGYRVATAARSKEDKLSQDGRMMELLVDLADPHAVAGVFVRVKAAWGVPPSVVVYNGAARTLCDPEDPISSFTLEDFNRDMAVNVTSAFVAAQHALAGFKDLPASSTTSKTFIYTGNKLNVMSIPEVFCFGMGKSAVAHMIWDASISYRKRGFKFYFTDERFDDGSPARTAISGEASGKLYLKLVEDDEQGPWDYTYVKDKGYVDFTSIKQEDN